LIDLARELLAEIGLLPPGSQPRINISFSRGTALGAQIYLNAEDFVYVKASEFERLEGEYEASRQAWAHYPNLLPEPLAFRSRHGWDIVVTRGVRSGPLGREHLDSAALSGALLNYFSRSAQITTVAPRQSHPELLADLREDPSTAPWAGKVLDALPRDVVAMVGALPHRPQHCDFTRNNVGVVGDGIVIFDWEDFGQQSLPGLDLCTFVLSLADAGPRRFRELLKQPFGAGGDFVGAAAQRIGLSREQFRSAVPIYLLVFLRLKGRYAAGIRLALERLLDEHLQKSL